MLGQTGKPLSSRNPIFSVVLLMQERFLRQENLKSLPRSRVSFRQDWKLREQKSRSNIKNRGVLTLAPFESHLLVDASRVIVPCLTIGLYQSLSTLIPNCSM